MSDTVDAIVIGSGFGGSVVACRLAERGLKVLVLERGRRWLPSDYPRKPSDPWFYSIRHPEKRHGWLDVRLFKRMIVAQAAGVGGGSLAYSGVALEAHPSCFDHGWPPELSYTELKPYYDRVAQTMQVQTIPDGQLTQRSKLARSAAEALGHLDRFSKAPLAMAFSPEWHYGLDAPFDRRHSRGFVNAQGVQQGTCIHLGNCDIGCDVRAKNTLDVNYLPLAERHGCIVSPLHVVRRIETTARGYRVGFDRIVAKGQLVAGSADAPRVYLAAGSLGTTELLLRARDEHVTLPKLSRVLGQHWSANANVLSMATYSAADRVDQSVGPTITSMVDFTDGPDRQRFVIEDDGFPNPLLNALRAPADSEAEDEPRHVLRAAFEDVLRENGNARGLMVWLGAGVDAGDGALRLARHWLPPFRRELDLRWDVRRSRAVIEAIIAAHRRMTEVTGGRFRADHGWQKSGRLLTLHPLGGCRMAASAETGVVDHLGRVFGYPGLHVVDGSIVPVPIGRNPSHTIAALAERIAAHVA